ncbi:MAG: alpha-L-rhamnosidase C-terminal domain-containing protein, partial [Lentisphaeria bacterium]
NGEPIYEAGVHQLQPGETYETGTAYCFRQKGEARTSVPLRLKEGWNRFDFFEKIVPGTFGMAMVLTGFGAGSLKLVQEPKREAMPGWCIAGPLRTPLPNILGHLVLNQFDILDFYIPVKERPLDEAAMLSAYRFDPEKGSSADLTQNQDITLKQDDYAVLRLPHCHYGCPSFKISGTKGDVVYVVSSTEFDTGFVPPCFSDQKNVDTMILGKGESQWTACLPRGLQYIMIVARQVEDSVSIKESAAIVRKYSFENMGHFESSDKAMNEMWETGRRTLSTTVQEIFIDSPSRDEAQYVGDALIQSWAAYHVYGDFGLAQKSLKEFAHCQFETGEMPAACPSSYYINIPDYALLWPLWLHQHYMYTGSRQIIETLMPNLQRLLNYFESVATGSAGLLDGLDRFGGYCFLDHGDIDREGISTGLNALYSRALLSSAFIMEETGKPKEAKNLRDRAGRICNALRELCWDADKGLFADSFHDGKMSESFSLQTNILAIYGGVALSGNYSSIFRKIFADQPPYYRDMPANTNTPYFNYFILETAFALGHRQWACEFMRWYWNSMLEDGARTWWELYDPRADKNNLFVGSKCHGYGVSPNGFLVREIAGVRPAKPGFTSIYFNPLTANLSSVKATIPTPYGHIMVDWKYTKDGQLEALIDANYPLSVIPELEPKVAKSAFIRVSDEVTVFASA